MSKKQRHEGEHVTVTYDPDICEHAAECVRGLPEVFDTSRRPWVTPDAADPERVIEVVGRCPTGALQIEGAQQIEPPEPFADTSPEDKESQMSDRNQVRISAHGPAVVTGKVKITTPDGEVIEETTNVALCRCGSSADKPFCDGSHKRVEFDDPGILADAEGEDIGPIGDLDAVLAANGPVIFRGAAEWCGADGATVRFSKRSMCRCGNSGTKPYCDGSHKRVGFDSDGR